MIRLMTKQNEELGDFVARIMHERRLTSYWGTHEETGEPCYGVTTEDSYGDPVCYVLAGDLCQIPIKDNGTTKAIWAYLSHLPPMTKVAVYWH